MFSFRLQKPRKMAMVTTLSKPLVPPPEIPIEKNDISSNVKLPEKKVSFVASDNFFASGFLK